MTHLFVTLALCSLLIWLASLGWDWFTTTPTSQAPPVSDLSLRGETWRLILMCLPSPTHPETEDWLWGWGANDGWAWGQGVHAVRDLPRGQGCCGSGPAV